MTPLTPRVAVHLVTYNNEATITACLEALLAQEALFEVCIIDNASTDRTVERIRAIGLPVQINATNLGYAVAHNQAIAQTHSDYVLTLNPDLLLQPGFLGVMCGVLDENPTLGSAAGCLLRVESIDQSPTAIDSVGLFMRRNRRQGLLLDNAPLSQIPPHSSPIFGPDGAAAFYRRTMLEDIAVEGEIFDEDFFIHKEDVDICWRAQLAGWTSCYVPDAIAHHIRSFRPGQRVTVSPYLRQCAVRNRYLLMIKNETTSLFRRDLLRIFMYDVAVVLFIVLRERSSFPALTSAWSLRKRMGHKRRIIQAKRRVNADDVRWLFS